MKKLSIYEKIKEFEDNILETKNNGIIYTPLSIVSYMIDNANIKEDSKIIEPSCGHGVFIFYLLEYMMKVYKKNIVEVYTWFVNQVTCIDYSEKTIKEFKELLDIWFNHHGLNGLSYNNVIAFDTLHYKTDIIYDICIGNPPYIRTKNIEKEYLLFLRQNFSSCKLGNIDIYYAFIEKMLNTSKNLIMIIPNRFLLNKSGETIKKIILSRLYKIIDFQQHLVFNNARIYTCIIFCSNINTQYYEYSNNINQITTIKNKNEVYQEKNETIEVLSGIETLRNNIFKVKKEDAILFEKDILRPHIKLSTVKEETIDYDYFIFPYYDTIEKKIIKEDEMIINFPKAYNYLKQYKKELSLRDKGKKTYEEWYAYGRKQGFHNITVNEIIILPRMIGNTCKPFSCDITEIQKHGSLLFTSGYVIPVKDNKIKNIILSEHFINLCKKYGKIYPGKNEPYYEISTNIIKKAINVILKT